MKIVGFFLLISLFLVGCGPSVSRDSLLAARKAHQTHLIKEEKINEPVPSPAGDLTLVNYESPLGSMPAYLSARPQKAGKHPAIIWIAGGFDNSIGDYFWTPASGDNDQSAMVFRRRGIVTMYPSMRGGNMNPGYVECLYGEIDDILAAGEYLKTVDYVDPNRIYLGGHSTGGTAVLLAAASSDMFRAVFSLGPIDNPKYYGQDYLTFDIGDKTECLLRSPIEWLHLIKSPTFVFEGEKEGNLPSVIAMSLSCTNERIDFFSVGERTHFSSILPVSQEIVREIGADDGPTCTITFEAGGMLHRLKKP